MRSNSWEILGLLRSTGQRDALDLYQQLHLSLRQRQGRGNLVRRLAAAEHLEGLASLGQVHPRAERSGGNEESGDMRELLPALVEDRRFGLQIGLKGGQLFFGPFLAGAHVAL